MLTCTGNVWHISGGPILEYDWSKVPPVGRKHGEESNFYGCPALFYDDFWEVIFGDTNPAALKTFYGTDWGGYVTRPGVNDLLDPPNNYLRAVYGWPTDAPARTARTENIVRCGVTSLQTFGQRSDVHREEIVRFADHSGDHFAKSAT